MSFSHGDLRIASINGYMDDLISRTTGILESPLPKADRAVVELLFNELRRLSIETLSTGEEIEISNGNLGQEGIKKFELQVASAINQLNNCLNTKGHDVLAKELFNFAKTIISEAKDANKKLHAAQSASGTSYLEKVTNKQNTQREMLDAEAISVLLDCANLPDDVGHYEGHLQRDRSLEPHVLAAIQQELTGYKDTTTAANPVTVAPKKYVIATLSESNSHWYGNIYQLVGGKATPMISSHYSYAMGDNTCGISAVARSLQEIQGLKSQYKSNLPLPNAPSHELRERANRVITQYIERNKDRRTRFPTASTVTSAAMPTFIPAVSPITPRVQAAPAAKPRTSTGSSRTALPAASVPTVQAAPAAKSSASRGVSRPTPSLPTILPRTSPTTSVTPLSTPANTASSGSDTKVSSEFDKQSAITAQAQLLAQFSQTLVTAKKASAKDTTKDWEIAYSKYNDEQKKRFLEDSKLALKLAIDELTNFRP